VDPIAVEDIQSVVAKLKYKNIGILITDHNVNETLSICDRAYLLIEGKIFKHGTAEQLAENEQVRRLYLGRNFELKRKDYLLEENKLELHTQLTGIIRATELAIANLEKMEENQREKSESANGGGSSENGSSDIEDFEKVISELKEDLTRYAQNYQDTKLLEKADRLVLPGLGLKTELQSLLEDLIAKN
jgi:ABC-type multidrug transport system ATPase subunit